MFGDLSSSNPGNQTNALVSVSREVSAHPVSKNDSKELWMYYYPLNSILLEYSLNESSLLSYFGLSPIHNLPRNYYSSNSLGLFYTLPHVNSILAEEYIKAIDVLSQEPDKANQLNIVRNPSGQINVNYSQMLVNIGLEMGQQWNIMGVNNTSPYSRNGDPMLKYNRQLLLHIRGSRDVENCWSNDVTSGDWCFLVLKMVEIDKRPLIYDLGKGATTKHIQIPSHFLGSKHYIPQIVAYSSAQPFLETGTLSFTINDQTFFSYARLIGQVINNPNLHSREKRYQMGNGEIVADSEEERINSTIKLQNKKALWMLLFLV